MGDKYPQFKVAAVQAAPVFLDREGSTEKACELIREAAENGAKMIGFPEGFIPAHPIWFHFHPGTDRIGTSLSVELFKNSVQVPGPEISKLGEAARQAGAYVVMGLCEKYPNTLGTMYNTQVFIGPDGSCLGKHQKIMPTVGERLVHAGGFGDSFDVIQSEYGPISGLMCGENTNPLAVFGLIARGTRVHIMAWPNHFPVISRPMRDRVLVTSKSFAEMSKAYVISSCAVVDEEAIKKLQLNKEQQEFLRNPENTGGSIIIAPDTRVVAGPLDNREQIIYADVDFDLAIKMKIRHDFAGHYNRPDIFQLSINRSVRKLYRETYDRHPDDFKQADYNRNGEGVLKNTDDRISLTESDPGSDE